jgi:hypothetical protein
LENLTDCWNNPVNLYGLIATRKRNDYLTTNLLSRVGQRQLSKNLGSSLLRHSYLSHKYPKEQAGVQVCKPYKIIIFGVLEWSPNFGVVTEFWETA